jgi:hypothetical protein
MTYLFTILAAGIAASALMLAYIESGRKAWVGVLLVFLAFVLAFAPPAP